MKDLVGFIARSLVDNPDQVVVTEETAEGGQDVILLQVAESDLGKVIGKNGRTARAIRTILAASNAGGRRCRLEILE